MREDLREEPHCTAAVYPCTLDLHQGFCSPLSYLPDLTLLTADME